MPPNVLGTWVIGPATHTSPVDQCWHNDTLASIFQMMTDLGYPAPTAGVYNGIPGPGARGCTESYKWEKQGYDSFALALFVEDYVILFADVTINPGFIQNWGGQPCVYWNIWDMGTHTRALTTYMSIQYRDNGSMRVEFGGDYYNYLTPIVQIWNGQVIPWAADSGGGDSFGFGMGDLEPRRSLRYRYLGG